MNKPLLEDKLVNIFEIYSCSISEHRGCLQWNNALLQKNEIFNEVRDPSSSEQDLQSFRIGSTINSSPEIAIIHSYIQHICNNTHISDIKICQMLDQKHDCAVRTMPHRKRQKFTDNWEKGVH